MQTLYEHYTARIEYAKKMQQKFAGDERLMYFWMGVECQLHSKRESLSVGQAGAPLTGVK